MLKITHCEFHLTLVFAAGDPIGGTMAIYGWQGTKATNVESPTGLIILSCRALVTVHDGRANHNEFEVN